MMGWERNSRRVGVDVGAGAERRSGVGVERKKEREWLDRQGSKEIRGWGEERPIAQVKATKQVKVELKLQVEDVMRTFLISCRTWSWRRGCRQGCDRRIGGGRGSDRGRRRYNRVSRYTFHSLLYVSCSWQHAFMGNSAIHTQGPQRPQ